MVAISREHLKDLILNQKIVEGYEDLEYQLTANGIDFRVAVIVEVKDAGEVGLSKEDSKPPSFGNAYVLEGYESYIEGLGVANVFVLKKGEKVSLKSLGSYLVITAEQVNTPKDLFFKIEIRSSLFRYGQLILETAFGEAGYRGKLTFLMFSPLSTKLAMGARIAQVSFYKLSSQASYEDQKISNYQGGKVI